MGGWPPSPPPRPSRAPPRPNTSWRYVYYCTRVPTAPLALHTTCCYATLHHTTSTFHATLPHTSDFTHHRTLTHTPCGFTRHRTLTHTPTHHATFNHAHSSRHPPAPHAPLDFTSNARERTGYWMLSPIFIAERTRLAERPRPRAP